MILILRQFLVDCQPATGEVRAMGFISVTLVRRPPNRVLRAKRSDAGRVDPVESLVKLRSQRTNLLGCYQAYFHYLLSGG
jgi:hypothetical protein